MNAEPPIPEELWQQIPPSAQTSILVLIQHYEQRLAELEARLKQNYTNSSKPPSSDPPAVKPAPPKPPSAEKPAVSADTPRPKAPSSITPTLSTIANRRPAAIANNRCIATTLLLSRRRSRSPAPLLGVLPCVE
jgi:hypothetical protein